MKAIPSSLVFLLALICFDVFSNSGTNSGNDQIVKLRGEDSSLINENLQLLSMAKYFAFIDSSKAKEYLDNLIIAHSSFKDSTCNYFLNEKVKLSNLVMDKATRIKVFSADRNTYLDSNKEICAAKLSVNIGKLFFLQAEFDSAIVNLDLATSLYENNKLNRELGEALLVKGSVQNAKGDYISSIETDFAAADIFRTIGSRFHTAVSHMEIGKTYFRIKQFQKAIINSELARDEFTALEDQLGAALSSSIIAESYLEQKLYDTALTIFKGILPIIKVGGDITETTSLLQDIGMSYLGLGNIDSAYFFLKQSEKWNAKNNYIKGLTKNYLELGRLKLIQKEVDSAIYYVERALQLGKPNTDVLTESKLHLLLAEIYYTKGLLEESAAHYHSFTQLENTIQEESEILNSIAQEQYEKIDAYRQQLNYAKQREEIISRENQSQRNLILGMAIFGILMVSSLILVSVINERNKRLNQKLIEHQTIIESDLNIKKSLLSEIHHRVKNNLQVISSMLSIQSQYIEDPSLNDIMEECKMRINSMALIHESLYKRDANDITSFSSYIQQLIPRLIATYQVDERNIELDMQVEDIELSIDESTPCGLLINEVVSNSLKHAFPNQRKGKITIVMKKFQDEINLKISDNGVGLPEEIEPDNQDTFGFLLIYTLASQLEAEMQIQKEEGLSFDFVWKVKNYQMLS